MTDAKTQLLELLAVIPDGDKVGVKPRTVIAGHKRPGMKTVRESSRRLGSTFETSSAWTKQP
jgi:hypothetical protein